MATRACSVGSFGQSKEFSLLTAFECERLGRPVIPLSRRFRVDEMTDLHEVSDIAKASIHRKAKLAWSVWRLVTRRVSRSVSLSALDVIGRPRC